MKQFLTFGICLLSIVSYSQVYKFKAYQTYVREDLSKDIDPAKWNTVDFLVVVNLTKNKINTYGNKEGDYDLIKLTDDYTTKGGDRIITYTAVDEDGEKCTIQIIRYKDADISAAATIVIQYHSGELAFRVKKDD